MSVPLAVFVVLFWWFQAPAVRSDTLIVMTSGAFTAAFVELAPVYERAGHGTVVAAITTMGTGAESIASRLQRREPADVVIVPAESLDSFINAGVVVAASRIELARSSIAMAVRAGSHHPDISSADALKRALLEARSVAYSASVSGDYLVNELFPRLGIAEPMKAKARRIDRERVGAVVARGEAEIGFQQLSELLPIPGVDVVGVLSEDVQRVTTIAAGVATHSQHPDAARAFIRFLASPAAAAIVKQTGMNPIASVRDREWVDGMR